MKKNADELRREFVDFFVDESGQFKSFGNVGLKRTIVPLCRQIISEQEPILYETMRDWADDSDGGPARIHVVTMSLLAVGQWEGAWLIRQLHCDQLLKQEAKYGNREHKGEPACGLAIIAREIGSRSLCRHYATLSSAGDIYWEGKLDFLKHGGYGPTMLEQFESGPQQEHFRDRVRQQMREGVGDGKKPRYLEAFVAARWFGDAHAKHILDLGTVDGKAGSPFTEVLLDAVQNPNGTVATTTGTRFEAAAGILLASTPGFEVLSARQTTDEQVDLVVHYGPDPLTQLRLPAGPGLIECKSSTASVSSSELRDFGAKCLFHRVGFGILVTATGISGSGHSIWRDQGQAELVRRRFLADGLTILVLDISQLRGKARELRGLQDVLSADHDRLVFGPIAGEK